MSRVQKSPPYWYISVVHASLNCAWGVSCVRSVVRTASVGLVKVAKLLGLLVGWALVLVVTGEQWSTVIDIGLAVYVDGVCAIGRGGGRRGGRAVVKRHNDGRRRLVGRGQGCDARRRRGGGEMRRRQRWRQTSSTRIDTRAAGVNGVPTRLVERGRQSARAARTAWGQQRQATATPGMQAMERRLVRVISSHSRSLVSALLWSGLVVPVTTAVVRCGAQQQGPAGFECPSFARLHVRVRRAADSDRLRRVREGQRGFKRGGRRQNNEILRGCIVEYVYHPPRW